MQGGLHVPGEIWQGDGGLYGIKVFGEEFGGLKQAETMWLTGQAALAFW